MPDVAPLPRSREPEAARVLADSLVDDPGWIAVGPRARGRRLRMLRAHQRGVLALCRRRGGPVLAASADGDLAGVCICADEGKWPPPPWSFAFEARGIAIAGPATVVRSLRSQVAMHEAHPKEPHVYVWMLGVDPAAQRRGAGRALLGEVIDSAASRELPVYLETANPDNLPYYGSFGFEPTGDAPLPRGATIWFMRREPRA